MPLHKQLFSTPLLTVLTIFASVAITMSSLCADAQGPTAIPLNNANTLTAEFSVGAFKKISIAFKFADGKAPVLEGVVLGDVLQRQGEKDGKKVPESIPMNDAIVEFKGAGLSFRWHSRPCLARYTEVQRAALATVWDTRPAASQRFVSCEVRTGEHGAELWMEGRYCRKSFGNWKTARANAGAPPHTLATETIGVIRPLSISTIGAS
jgi:hypothetical protein